MFRGWEVSATRPLRQGETLRCSNEIENERNNGNIPPLKQLQGQEERVGGSRNEREKEMRMVANGTET